MPKLTDISSHGMYSAFGSCSSLTEASFPVLSSIGDLGMNFIFIKCSSLSSASFPVLSKIVGTYAMS